MHNSAYRDQVMKEVYDEMQRSSAGPPDDDDPTIPPS
jgi:hypothetical protein